MFFTYGVGVLSKEKFNKPNATNKYNKINGGLWCCPKNNLYSEWFVVTLACPELVRDPVPYDVFISDNANILKLTSENISSYTDSNKYIDFNSVKMYDAIHFTKDLVEKVEEFKMYLVESIQILNFDIISYENCYVDEKYVLSENFIKNMNIVLDKIENIISFYE
ncbi:hypothetical protein KGF43_15760 [Clostridioides sp. ZZV14-6044]|nr:hypothetical protein [Clostridioides sp. ZZV14-6044]